MLHCRNHRSDRGALVMLVGSGDWVVGRCWVPVPAWMPGEQGSLFENRTEPAWAANGGQDRQGGSRLSSLLTAAVDVCASPRCKYISTLPVPWQHESQSTTCSNTEIPIRPPEHLPSVKPRRLIIRFAAFWRLDGRLNHDVPSTVVNLARQKAKTSKGEFPPGNIRR